MTVLRAGLIGLGMMGRHHARNLRALDGVELVGVADANGDRFGAAGNVPVVSTLDAMIDIGIDYCVVALPTELHEAAGLQLADAGVHALIEKPLAASSAAAARVAEAFASRGLVGGVGHIERYNPALQTLRTRLANGDLGDLYQIATRRQGPFPARIADVGVVKDLASHDIDLTAWVTGRNYEMVGARSMFKSGRKHEDMVAVTAGMTGGLMANHLVNWLTPLKERLTAVTGEKGMFVADTLTADLTLYANGSVDSEWDDLANFRGVREGDITRYAIPKPEPLRTEHEAFRDAILERGSDIVTLNQGVAVVRVCEAIIESANTGQAVSINAVEGRSAA